MHQLVLPDAEMQAHSMELALIAPYFSGVDWGEEIMGYRSPNRSFYEEVLGQWAGPEDSFFDEYDAERLRALYSKKPWTQLLLPLNRHGYNYKRQADEDDRNAMRAWADRFAITHGRFSRVRPGVRPPAGLLALAEAELTGAGDRPGHWIFP